MLPAVREAQAILSPSALRDMTREAVLSYELQAASTGGVFLNRTFCAYTRRRTSEGIVDMPQTVFANEGLLRHTTEYFDTRTF